MSIIIWVRYFISPRNIAQNLLITIVTIPDGAFGLSEISGIIARHFKRYELKRFDEDSESVEVSFQIQVKDPVVLDQAKKELQDKSGSMSVTYIDNRSY